MRIDGFQNIPAVLQSFELGSPHKSSSGSEKKTSSSLSLSSFAEIFQTLQRESVESSKARGQRVEQLAQQAQAGNLKVNVEKIAQSLVDIKVIG